MPEFTLPNWTVRMIAGLDVADRRAESIAGPLSPAQLNWQPRPGVWSVGQCLEHLRVGNEMIMPAISAALEGQEEGRAEDIELGWFSSWFVRSFIAPNPGGARARAPKSISPGKEVDPCVLQGFLRANQAARELAKRAAHYDVNRIRYKNPFMHVLRFTVGTGLEIIEKHEGRHLLQAEGVKQSPGFPG
jgi:hypothetical protein